MRPLLASTLSPLRLGSLRAYLACKMVPLVLTAACQAEPTTAAVSATTPEPPGSANIPEPSAPASVQPPAPRSAESTRTPGVAELSVAGIGPVKLGMTYAELVWAGLDPQSIEGGAAVGPYRAGFAPARGGPIISVFVRLGDLPDGLRVGGKILKNESTSLQELADAVGSCEPIAPNIGLASTTCHAGRIQLAGAGPIGGPLTITVNAG